MHNMLDECATRNKLREQCLGILLHLGVDTEVELAPKGRQREQSQRVRPYDTNP